MSTIKEKVRELRQNQTAAEKYFWSKVRANKLGLSFRRQYPITFYDNNQQMLFIADFFCKELKLVIEIDGGIHLLNKEYDEGRTYVINQLGYQVIRFTNEQILNNFTEIEAILSPLAGKGGAKGAG